LFNKRLAYKKQNLHIYYIKIIFFNHFMFMN